MLGLLQFEMMIRIKEIESQLVLELNVVEITRNPTLYLTDSYSSESELQCRYFMGSGLRWSMDQRIDCTLHTNGIHFITLRLNEGLLLVYISMAALFNDDTTTKMIQLFKT